MAEETILVVGGGIGGLATALAVARRGRPVRVLERAPQFGAIGYGIQLGPNVFPMFERLGIADAVRERSILPGNVWMIDAFDGEPVIRVPTGDAAFRARYGHPYIVIHRVDLHEVMLAACRAQPLIELDEDADVTGFTDHGDGISVHTADGRDIDGVVLIGADGLRSTVRAQLLGDGEPALIGYVAHRTMVPLTDAPRGLPLDDVALWGGPGFHIVHYPLRDHALFNIVAVFRTATHDRKGDVASYRDELQSTYRDAHPLMREMIAMLDLERRWPIGDRAPRRGWSRGRALLLGDAAHATLQSLAQGACMAIEDAVHLAALLDIHGDDHHAAFRAFERARLPRTARVQLESRHIWNTLYHLDGAAAAARNAAWRARGDADVYARLDWLYRGVDLPSGA